MNVLASECSSGCESGWTLYLEQSFLSQHPSASHRGNSNGFCEEYKEKRCSYGNEDDEEEEDQSMVSDASSGPPHFNEDEVYFDENNKGCFYPPSKDVKTLKFGGKKQKIKEKGRCDVQDQQQQQPSFLDDTASSSFFNISRNNFMVSNNQASDDSVLDFSQGEICIPRPLWFLTIYSTWKSTSGSKPVVERKRMGMRSIKRSSY